MPHVPGERRPPLPPVRGPCSGMGGRGHTCLRRMCGTGGSVTPEDETPEELRARLLAEWMEMLLEVPPDGSLDTD